MNRAAMNHPILVDNFAPVGPPPTTGVLVRTLQKGDGVHYPKKDDVCVVSECRGVRIARRFSVASLL